MRALLTQEREIGIVDESRAVAPDRTAVHSREEDPTEGIVTETETVIETLVRDVIDAMIEMMTVITIVIATETATEIETGIETETVIMIATEIVTGIETAG